MKLKKTDKVSEPTAAASVGGATIADRFKLDAPDENAKKPAGVGTKVAVAAALIALVVAGFLAFTLWKHWEFLMPA